MKWKLLLQLVLSDGHTGEQPAVEQVIEAVQKLGLHPAEVERIAKALAEALPGATRPTRPAQHPAPVSVRVWISGADVKNRQHSRPDAESGDRPEYAGWGFFVVQRQEGDPQVSPGGSHDAVELYLYQEADLLRMRQTPSLQ